VIVPPKYWPQKSRAIALLWNIHLGSQVHLRCDRTI
jgi:hypothetical protein